MDDREGFSVDQDVSQRVTLVDPQSENSTIDYMSLYQYKEMIDFVGALLAIVVLATTGCKRR